MGIALAGCILIGIWITALGFQPKSNLTADPDAILIPTPVQSRAASGSSTPQINDLDRLSTEEQELIKNVQLSLPVEDDTIAIAYSPITQQFFVQKKSELADATFRRFLANNELGSFFDSRPEFFLFIDTDLEEEMLRIEEDARDILVGDDDDDEFAEPQKTNEDKIDEVVAQMNALKNLVGVIFSPPQTNTPTPTPSPTQPTITPTQPENQSSRDLDYAARNSCYRFRINRCDDIPESRPGVTNNTYPVDTALVNELFANPNAYGLRNRRWQFDAGMVHPKLVRFLNEFVKSNTLDRHLGIAGGTGRCCRRNGSTKSPATGCKLTPHRLGVAIDLDTLNGSRFIKAKQNDPGIRKALDWINAQQGTLRPDSVTMSPVFSGIYPFHPDSGHADHLHLDFSRSLNCQ